MGPNFTVATKGSNGITGQMHSTFTTADDLKLAYYIDDFTDPWRNPDTLLLLHAAGQLPAMVSMGAAARPRVSGRAARPSRPR